MAGTGIEIETIAITAGIHETMPTGRATTRAIGMESARAGAIREKADAIMTGSGIPTGLFMDSPTTVSGMTLKKGSKTDTVKVTVTLSEITGEEAAGTEIIL